MAEPQIQDQTIAPVTLHSGGVEGAPAVAVPEQGATEPQVEVAPHLNPPEVSQDLQEAGVRYNTINPTVSKEAVDAGVTPSIPTGIGTKFVVPNFSSVPEAEKVAQNAPVNESRTWSASEWVAEQLKRLKKAA